MLLLLLQDDARNEPQLTATTTVRITVTDADDLPPRFTYTGCTPIRNGVCFPQYSAVATIGQVGTLNVRPAPIRAVDGDETLNYPIR